MINRVEVLGHNNNFKYLYVHKQPVNNGFNNKFSKVGVMEQNSDIDENITYDTSGNQHEDSSSSSSSDDDDERGYTTTHNFEFTTGEGNFPNFNFSNVSDILRDVNLVYNLDQVNDELVSHGSSSDSEESDYYGGEEYEEEEEEKDEEAHISPQERQNIINSINSFKYYQKNKKEEEN